MLKFPVSSKINIFGKNTLGKTYTSHKLAFVCWIFLFEVAQFLDSILVFHHLCEIIIMFHSRPLVGRGKLDAARVTVGYLELALVTRVAIDGENKWIT